ncbi:hypothetical protein PLICRDRAFT_181011 [Plicaturopsis crispa FD-325 SS-3]|uniref:Uncharacterized protein n=1 Tax=Plicaturopsis crispa FD-325 SS-3 TaxID=944288 RepID=A0A0C9T3Z9_PLICR|nr:hypothetical protein PLICRDRAFT_181011 [Plicaturopsis crispa FD-325 SS-3]
MHSGYFGGSAVLAHGALCVFAMPPVLRTHSRCIPHVTHPSRTTLEHNVPAPALSIPPPPPPPSLFRPRTPATRVTTRTPASATGRQRSSSIHLPSMLRHKTPARAQRFSRLKGQGRGKIREASRERRRPGATGVLARSHSTCPARSPTPACTPDHGAHPHHTHIPDRTAQPRPHRTAQPRPHRTTQP